MVVWLFPGQGSQRRGMGAELFDRYPEQVAAADAELGYSIARLCRDDPDDQLRDTAYAQPALFVVCALSYLDRIATEPPPRLLAGHSLGEYAALFAAGCFDLATGVRLVRRRGELMSRVRGGGMLAVVRAPVEAVTELLSEGRHHAVDVANHNAADQVVLAGPQEALRAVAADLADRKLGRAVPLRVSAAFHSRYMADAQRAFADFLTGVPMADPRLPVLSNVTARPHRPGAVARALVDQICQPVRWADSMRYLIDQGVTEAAELGPGTVLTELWRSARRNHRPAAVSAATGPVPAETVAGPGSVPAEERVSPAEPAGSAETPAGSAFGAEALGSADFRRDYGIRYAYLAGSMYQGIASTDLVLRMGRAGLLGFFGTGGLRLERIEDAIATLQRELGVDGRYGMNLLCMLDNPELERAIVETYLRHGVRFLEAAAYPQITPALVRWRYSGAYRDRSGRPVATHRVLAKVSRPEVAAAFMSPPPARLVAQLAAAGDLTAEEAELAGVLPVSDDVCVESDSGGHTDAGVALTLLPAMMRLRDDLMVKHDYPDRIRIGAAGGLGAPHAVAAAFVLGADFVVTGSVNQCSPEAGTSAAVKDLLATLDVQDTTYAPAGDLFELGAQVQVARKGTLFPVRANKLYQVYRRYGSLDEIDARTRRTLEDEYFGRSFDQIWAETREYLAQRHPAQLARAERDPRRRMVLVFRWYFRHSTEVALRGDPAERVNYQVHCGPAMGAFNRWVEGTDLQDWRARHVDVIAERLMSGAAEVLAERFAALRAPIQAGAQH